jgi:hypothetical protein
LASLVEFVDPRRMVLLLIDQADQHRDTARTSPRDDRRECGYRVRSLGTAAKTAEVRATHRRPKRQYKNAFACPRSLIPISRRSRTGSPSSRSSPHWPSLAGSPRSILRCSATNSIRSFTPASVSPTEGGGDSHRIHAGRRNTPRGCGRRCM